ncbi:MAG: YkgJ family cysteine cluster protein [Phycisphaerales bacterium]|nr:YkgJ family cysteine cluster protein [Planctomycetota bacterium]MBL6997404.1 YkgJ family cysteine cluster protein [Phycisphaerales bacterium]
MSDWFEDGLCFSCMQSGNCCTGPPGAVWFNDEEGRAMAKKLNLAVETFYQRYTRMVGTRWSLRENSIDGKYDCVFLNRKTKKPSCLLYEARPSQCRTWPFWPENLSSETDWHRAKKETPCPGMDSGKLIPASEIRIQRDSKYPYK